MTRRQMLRTMGTGLGTVGLSQLLASNGATGIPTHFAPRAKHVIFLFLNGGPSQVDTFDPKPMLTKFHGKPMPQANLKTERKTGNLLASPFAFKRHGQSGIEVSEIFSKVGECIDDVCVIRSMHTDRPNHEPSLFMMNTGTTLPGRPSMGSWLTYGLGSENHNLPGYLVLCPGFPVIGPQLWSSAFLPATFQGTHIANKNVAASELIPYIHNASYKSEEQRRQLDLLGKLNHAAPAIADDPQVEASIQSMETAFRMQTEAPDIFDISKEKPELRARYGDGDFARGCLMAVRLVEKGVRMVQVYYGNDQPWDNHDDIMIHRKLAHGADAPIAALLQDLKARGLLQDTLVIVGGEFGRTPVMEVSGLVKVQNGRDHNNHGFSMLLAGGGVKGGMTYGATDDFGFKAIENPVHPHDLHATILHLFGYDHTRLTYRYSGRDFRLTDVEGTVIHDILA
jgi:hypothetical protein